MIVGRSEVLPERLTWNEFVELGDEKRRRAVEKIDNVFHSKALPGFFIRESWLRRERLSASEASRELKIL